MNEILNIIPGLLNGLFNGLNLGDFMRMDIWGDLTSEFSSTGAAIDSYMIDLINNKLLAYGGRLSNHFIGTACALGAIFAICVAAGQAYKMMAKGEALDVLKFMRPVFFALILSFWPAICNTLIVPGQYVEKFMRAEYVKAARKMTNLQEDRKELALKVFDDITQKKASADSSKEKVEREWHDISGHIADAWNSAIGVLANAATLASIHIMYGIEWVIVQIGEMVFAVCVYIVFLAKVLYITVLWMFGPIWFVCSILSIWETQWSQWVGRLISVSMYGAMAYLCMTFACYMICMTLMADINKLNKIQLNPDIGMGEYLKSGFGTTIMTFVGYMTGAIAMGTVYELASLTFPSQAMHGGASFVSGMKGYAIKASHTKPIFAS